LGGKGPLAALPVGHRPLRVCFLRAPCQSNPSLPNRTPPHFQTGSYSLESPQRPQARSRGAPPETSPKIPGEPMEPAPPRTRGCGRLQPLAILTPRFYDADRKVAGSSLRQIPGVRR
jgi:hypothetical protein